MVVLRYLQFGVKRYIYSQNIRDCVRCLRLDESIKRAKSSSAQETNEEENSDDETGSKLKKRQNAIEKLNSLLTSMKVNESPIIGENKMEKLGLNLAKPVKNRKPKIAKEKVVVKKEKDEEEEELMKAVKQVAKSLGGDIERTESELLQKLKEPKEINEKRKHSLSEDLFKGMKIERSKTGFDVGQKAKSKFDEITSERLGLERNKKLIPSDILKYQSQHRRRVAIDIFGSGQLKIFTQKSDKVDDDKPILPEMKTWKNLSDKFLESHITHPPVNAFEEMIKWTNENKIWKFPINNDQDLDDEAKIGFHEHVFLDHLLDQGFPKKGPVRHYMELVVTALGKTPFFTVKEKHDHIEWYRQYFKSKSDILIELGINE